MMPTTLYVLKDMAGAVLYVGISMQVTERLESHRTSKPWWTDVAEISVTHFESREDAHAAEAALIRTLRPRHNGMLKPKRPVVQAGATIGCTERSLAAIAAGGGYGKRGRYEGLVDDLPMVTLDD